MRRLLDGIKQKRSSIIDCTAEGAKSVMMLQNLPGYPKLVSDERIFQVRKRDTQRIYAVKILPSRQAPEQEVAHILDERKLLPGALESPFFVGLRFSFRTEAFQYLVADFRSGGELFWHLEREKHFPEDRARFYAAELIIALEHLHKCHIVFL